MLVWNVAESDDRNSTVRFMVSVPRWLRERLVEVAARDGVSVSELCSVMLLKACGDTIGVPAPPPAVAPIPSVSDVLRDYVSGEGRLVGPCGERWPCGFERGQGVFIGDLEFCSVCNVRVN